MYHQMDAPGSEAILTGTTADQIPINKSDYAPNPEYNELDIPAYNGQMEVKDFSLQWDNAKSSEGRSPQD